MKKFVPFVALGVMAVGLLFVAFGAKILPPTQTLPQPVFLSANTCSASVTTLCYPISEPVYYMQPQSEQPNLTLNYIGAGLALLGAVVFGATCPTNIVRLPFRLLPTQI